MVVILAESRGGFKETLRMGVSESIIDVYAYRRKIFGIFI